MSELGLYTLDGHEPVAVAFQDDGDDRIAFDAWAEWLERSTRDGSRSVGLTEVRGVEVSTVFLAIDSRLGRVQPPLLFETMIFGRRAYNRRMWRWATWDEAESGHRLIVAAIASGRDPSTVLP